MMTSSDRLFYDALVRGELDAHALNVIEQILELNQQWLAYGWPRWWGPQPFHREKAMRALDTLSASDPSARAQWAPIIVPLAEAILAADRVWKTARDRWKGFDAAVIELARRFDPRSALGSRPRKYRDPSEFMLEDANS